MYSMKVVRHTSSHRINRYQNKPKIALPFGLKYPEAASFEFISGDNFSFVDGDDFEFLEE